MSKNDYESEKGQLLANYINSIKDSRGLGLNQLALLSGIDNSVLHKILHGAVKKVNPFHLQAISKTLKIDYRILYRIVGYLDDDLNPDTQNNSKIPIYSNIKTNKDNDLIFGEVLEFIEIPSISFGSNIIGLSFCDHSMNPNILYESSILVSINSEVLSGQIAMFILNNEIIVRRFWRVDGKIFLTADNPSYQPILIYNFEELHIVGKVILVQNKM